MKNCFLVILLCFSVFGFILLPFVNILANDTSSDKYGIETIYSQTGGKFIGGTPAEIIARIINYVMGFIGILLVGLIVYGGIMYMTSAGSEDKIKSAKAILTYSIIGIVVIFAAYLIAQYVIGALTG